MKTQWCACPLFVNFFFFITYLDQFDFRMKLFASISSTLAMKGFCEGAQKNVMRKNEHHK